MKFFGIHTIALAALMMK